MTKFYSTHGRLVNFVLIVLALLVLYQHRYGLGMLLPTNDGWLMKHDWATNYLGWFFYRNEPWGFPIGKISNYLYPVGTNIGFTDIPLPGIFFKIFSPLLPDKFQYIGAWLLLSHVLLAWFLLKLFEVFSVRGLVQLLATLVVVFNPVLIHRSFHPALCCHWMIVASLWIYFLDTKKYAPEKLMMYQGWLLVIGGLINPFFGVIEAGFLVALAWRIWLFDRRLSFTKTFLLTAGAMAGLFISWYVVGFFAFNSQDDLGIGGGYGLYSYNLTSLYNSMGWSALIPTYPTVSWHQYESFMYAGAGMIWLFYLVVVLTVIRFTWKRMQRTAPPPGPESQQVSIIPLLTFVIFISLFAITNVVTWNDQVLFRFPISDRFQKIGDIFRASARFFWVAYYLVLIFVLLAAIRQLKYAAVSVIALTIVFAIQLYDYKLLLGSEYVARYDPYHPPISEAQWRPMFSRLDRFVFYPAFQTTQLTDQDYRYFCYLAADEKKPINLGYVARQDNKAMTDYADELKRTIGHGDVDENTLYVTTSDYVGRFVVPYQAGLIRCGQLDGYYFFYPQKMENDSAFSRTTKEIPSILTDRLTFIPFALAETDQEAEISMEIERLERTNQNIFLKGWITRDPSMNINGQSILLKSEDQQVYRSPVAALSLDAASTAAGRVDSVRFNATYFSDHLPPGQYKIGAYLSAVDKKKSRGFYRFFGTISVGLPDIYEPELLTLSLHPLDSPKLQLWTEVFEEFEDKIKISGWAFFLGQSSFPNRIEILLKSGEKVYHTPTDHILRPDVTSYFSSPHNLETSGFVAFISKKGLARGEYVLGVRLSNDALQQEGIEYTDKKFEVK